MAMVSPRLQRDIEWRVRAAYSVDLDKHRCSSVPTASIRYHCMDETDRAATAPATEFRGYRASALGSRFMLPTKHIRIARSEPPPSCAGRYLVGLGDRNHRPTRASSRCLVGQEKQTDRTGQKGDFQKQGAHQPPTVSNTAVRTPDVSLAENVEAPLSSEDGFSSVGGNSKQPDPMPTAGAGRAEWSRGRTEKPKSELDSPKKIMQVMEERDRAIHVCLQYRCKLKNTEGSLRAEERLASDLKAQLREANAAGEATRKLFDQVMDKVRADEGRKLRQEASNRKDDRNNTRFAEETRKARLQLARARKDLRELWLERDELALLAGQAMQGEAEGCKRIKKLELALSGLKEQVAALVQSEQKAAGGVARAETRAELAELAERELRESVKTIKADFEVLVRDLRRREKQIRCLEAKNETLADKAVAVSPTPLEVTRSRHRQRSPASMATARDQQQTIRPRKRTSCRAKLEAGAGVRRDEHASSEGQRAPGVRGPSSCFANPAAKLRSGQEPATKREVQDMHNTDGESPGRTMSSTSAAFLPRKQLTPPTANVPKRVSTMSYPRCGSRATFTPIRLSCPENTGNTGTPLGNEEAFQAEEFRTREEEAEEEEEEEEVVNEGEEEEPKQEYQEHVHQEEEEEEEEEEQQQQQQKREAYRIPLVDSAEKLAEVGSVGRVAGTNEVGEERGERSRIPSLPASERRLSGCCSVEKAPPPPRRSRHPSTMPPLTARPSDLSTSPSVRAPDPAVNLGSKDPSQTVTPDPAGESKAGEEVRAIGGRRDEGVIRTVCPEGRASDNGVVAETVPPPPQPSAATAGSSRIAGGVEPVEEKRPVGDACVEGAECEARRGSGVGAESSIPHGLEEIQVGEDTQTTDFRSKLMGGVPVLKYGGRGKPKPKTLWVAPDLSEIFYTQAGRTKNSKKSAHMPLAGLCASRGRSNCPDLLRAPAGDRRFALVHQTDPLLAGNSPRPGEKHGGHAMGGPEGSSEGSGLDGGGVSPTPGRRKWGIGGTLPANLAHGRRWRGGSGSEAVSEAATATVPAPTSPAGGWTGWLSASSTPGSVAAAAGGAPGHLTGGRERMELETASAEECTALIDEINELVRLAGLKHGGGGSSRRGQELFDEWVRSAATAERGANGSVGFDKGSEAVEGCPEASRSVRASKPVVLLAAGA